MTLFTLKELALTKSQREGKSYLHAHSPVIPTQTQQQLHLLIKQKRLGLPIQPMLKANPLLSYWIEQLEECFPALFNPKKKLYLDVPLTGKLTLNSQQQYRIQVPINVGYGKERIQLFDWRVELTPGLWTDHLKLWVAHQYFQQQPSQLKMTVFVLHSSEPLEKITINLGTQPQFLLYAL